MFGNKTDRIQYVPSDLAKTKVDLHEKIDGAGKKYFIGEHQYPGTMSFSHGVSFWVFISEEGVEQLHFGPMAPERAENHKFSSRYRESGSKICIPMNMMEDRNHRVFYVGELLAPIEFNLEIMLKGLFFTFFLGDECEDELGRRRRPELQIGQLDQALLQRRRDHYKSQKQQQRMDSDAGSEPA